MDLDEIQPFPDDAEPAMPPQGTSSGSRSVDVIPQEDAPTAEQSRYQSQDFSILSKPNKPKQKPRKITKRS
jgi:hypothetical protein